MNNLLTHIRDTKAKSPDGHIKSLFKCECGNVVEKIKSRVKNNYTRSCGCLSLKGSRKTHGHKTEGRASATYNTWGSMKNRCLNPLNKDYKRYGGVGITVCEEWASSFEKFLSDMGERPLGTSIDRIDPNKGYFKENCRWATPREQMRNRKDFTIVIYEGEKIALVDLAKRLGISKGAAHMRLKRGKFKGVDYV